MEPAIVTFFNASRYKVDVYKGINPAHYDPSALVCTLNSGEDKQVEQYPSYDPDFGDAFFMHYNVLLEDRLHTGTTDVYVNAQRVLSNITFPIESGGRYTKTIPQPADGDLKFYHGYIEVKNQGKTQIQILRGDTILTRMDNNGVLIAPDGTGWYEITFTAFDDDTITMNQLKIFSDHNVPVPSFAIEKGKKYSFTVQGDTVSDPVIENILY